MKLRDFYEYFYSLQFSIYFRKIKLKINVKIIITHYITIIQKTFLSQSTFRDFYNYFW